MIYLTLRQQVLIPIFTHKISGTKFPFFYYSSPILNIWRASKGISKIVTYRIRTSRAISCTLYTHNCGPYRLEISMLALEIFKKYIVDQY